MRYLPNAFSVVASNQRGHFFIVHCHPATVAFDFSPLAQQVVARIRSGALENIQAEGAPGLVVRPLHIQLGALPIADLDGPDVYV